MTTDPVPATTAATRLLCVLGHPVGHSLSPRLHSAAITAAGHDAVYLAFDVASRDLAAAVEGLRALAGEGPGPAGGGWLGANVTIPHKAGALEAADDATDEAAFVGAANTLFWEGGAPGAGRLVADNTDATGLIEVLRRDCGLVEGDHAVVFGSGGAARAAAVALGRLGAVVTCEGRRPDAAQAIAALANTAGGAAPRGTPGPPRVVINATPLGRHGEPLPDHLMALGEGQTALDLNYGSPSPFLARAADAGAMAVDGLGMLVAQAEAAYARWFGAPPPPGAMSAAAGSPALA